MKWLSVPLCALLLVSGCSLSQVNEVAIIDYERQDNAGEVALKTAGNVVVWGVALPVGVAIGLVLAIAQSGGASGGISRSGVKLDDRSEVDPTNRVLPAMMCAAA